MLDGTSLAPDGTCPMLDSASDAAVAASAPHPLAQTDLLSGASLPLAQRDLPSGFRSNLTPGNPDEPRSKRLHDDCDVDISDDEDGWIFWQGKRKKQTRTTQQERVSLPRYQVLLRTTDGTAVTDIPHLTLDKILERTITKPRYLDATSLRKNVKANSILITVYDEEQANRLCTITRLAVAQGPRPKHVSVEMTRLSHNSSTSKGVISISPNETNDQLMSCLHNELVEILDVKRLGRSNKALITFNSAKTPRTVRYHYEILPVAPYRPKTLVCLRCHKEGHMVRHCPNEEVCQECGIVHALKENDICKNACFCSVCKETGHLATSNSCPNRRKQKTTKQSGRRANRARSRSRSESRSRSRSKTRKDTVNSANNSSGMDLNASKKWSDVVSDEQPVTSRLRDKERRLQELTRMIDDLQKTLETARQEMTALTTEINLERNRQVRIVSPPGYRRENSKQRSQTHSSERTKQSTLATKSDLLQIKAQVLHETSKETHKEMQTLNAKLDNSKQIHRTETEAYQTRLNIIETKVNDIAGAISNLNITITALQERMESLAPLHQTPSQGKTPSTHRAPNRSAPYPPVNGT